MDGKPAAINTQADRALVEPAWLTTPEAERYSGLSRVTLWKLRGEGRIRAARVGRAVRYERASLEAFMQQSAS